MGSDQFGWLEEPIEYPDEFDFESEDEYDKAYDRYEEFRNSAIGFVYMDDHNFIPFNGYSFEIDECGDVIFTSAVNHEDECEGDFEEDVWYSFTPWVANNWESCIDIVRLIECELGISEE